MGPGLLTSAVNDWLGETRGVSLEDLSSVAAGARGTLVGDTLVLGIDGFGCGQPHSRSRPCNASGFALVQHLFAGAWKVQPEPCWWADDSFGRRRRRRSGEFEDWRLPGLALMAHAKAFGVHLPWEMVKLFFSRVVPTEPPLLPLPPP
mmetsp:Transcript_13894/g.36899  ORF Transcript_13894/g.36899 Transcript_13894/m.36899 type:complete len:148 (+) Transcript_13894:94-537(+)